MNTTQSNRLIYTFNIWLLPLVLGLGVTLSLAPFNIWPLALLSVSGLLYLIHKDFSRKKCLCIALSYGIGMYGSGVTWIFVSLNDYSSAPAFVALLVTIGFVLLLSAIFTLQIGLYGKYFKHRKLGLWLAFPALWVLFEWVRSWLFTGFPWLYLGYAHINSPLAGFAPIGGVFLLSFLSIITSIILLRIVYLPQHFKLVGITSCIALWLGGHFLYHVEWTQLLSKRPLKAAAIQGNIPLELKWQPEYAVPSIRTYEKMTEEVKPADLVLWPETAIPLFQNQAKSHIKKLNTQGALDHTTIITGIPYWEKVTENNEPRHLYFNSIIALGLGDGVYHKQKLVPFGEYIPFEALIRKIDIFDFPMSSFHAGSDNQALLKSSYAYHNQILPYKIAPFICYEIMFPSLVNQFAKQANLIVTVSNDAWFGRSIGPDQHLQMAQMRALEAGKYIVRATNTGTSAIIDQKGRMLASSELFVSQTITANIKLFEGSTPHSNFGVWPILCLIIFSLLTPFCTRYSKTTI